MPCLVNLSTAPRTFPTSKHIWCIPPEGFFFKKFAIGELSPIGSSSSSLILGRCTKATVTPCSGRECGELTGTPRMALNLSVACWRFGTAIAIWLSLPARVSWGAEVFESGRAESCDLANRIVAFAIFSMLLLLITTLNVSCTVCFIRV